MSWETSFPEPSQWNGDDDRPWHGKRPDVRCDACNEPIEWGGVCLPFGKYCSTACADVEQAKFDERMKRRGFQEVQPDLLVTGD